MDAESELARERAVLLKADDDIARGETRIAAQENLVRDLRASGDDAWKAEHLLQLLRDTLAQWLGHRDLIQERIAYLESRVGERSMAPDLPDGRA